MRGVTAFSISNEFIIVNYSRLVYNGGGRWKARGMKEGNNRPEGYGRIAMVDYGRQKQKSTGKRKKEKVSEG
jgi:hypothetical protein